MKRAECVNCSQRQSCRNSLVSWIFFVVGLISTVAIRIATVLMDVHPLFGKISWYVGVGGFFLFFIYKYLINRALANAIDKKGLLEKAREHKTFSVEENNLIADILCSLKSEKERINYFFIFAVSAVALVFAIYFDFIK